MKNGAASKGAALSDTADKEIGMRRFFTALCMVLASILIIVAMLVISIESFALDRGFYESEYEKLGTAKDIGISKADLTRTTDVLLRYTSGERNSLDMQAKIGGEMQEVFGKREKDHMVDVQKLYIGARDVRTYGLIAAAVLIIISFILSRGKAVLALCRSFLYVSGAFLALVAVITFFALSDFGSFWTSFHHVFFTNDLWILDPSTDVLIQMVPQQFFFDLVTRIIIRFVAIFAGLNIGAFAGKYLYKRYTRMAKLNAEG